MQRNLSLLFLHYARLDRKRTSQGLGEDEKATWLRLKRYLNQALAGGRDIDSDRRDSVRVPAELACKFGAIQAVHDGVIGNLSRSGLFVRSADPLPVGSRVWLRLRDPRNGSDIDVVGVVATSLVKPGTPPERVGMGIRFEAIDANVRDALDEIYRDAIVSRFSAVAVPADAPIELADLG
jgi:uncharacterized protein (TIGR02266 family)